MIQPLPQHFSIYSHTTPKTLIKLRKIILLMGIETLIPRRESGKGVMTHFGALKAYRQFLYDGDEAAFRTADKRDIRIPMGQKPTSLLRRLYSAAYGLLP